ncbi:outer membrane protein assembly factor BamB family protein [Streptomyces violascens]|uniref:outer membrane protein assembly factor BamB family protein n=1 Tax=Streptomyces violascens TaxID=67381 RepID=UPI00167BC1E4|nr:PQQ-binding-like beta-propeller repeat protein [Streptomyces violascens]
MPTTPPNVPPPTARRARLWPGIVAIIAGSALVLGCGTWYLTSGGDSDSSRPAASAGKGADGNDGNHASQAAPPSAKMLFHQFAPKVSNSFGDRVFGEWLSDKAYAKTGFKEVTGYDRASGTQLWKLPLPTQVCATTLQSTADGITVIAYDSEKGSTFEGVGDCYEIAAFNITTGKMLWHASTPTIGVSANGGGDRKIFVSEIAISGGTAAVGSASDGGAAWDIATGKQLWKPTANAENCQDDGYAGGPALVAVRRCGDYARPSLSVQTLDPATGQPLSTYKVPSAFSDVHVLSSKPLVVGGYPGEGSGAKISDIYSIDEKTGKELAHITIPDEKYAIDCKKEVGTCLGPLAGGGKLFLPTADHANTSPDVPGQTNEFVAFDLATGKPVPGRADAGDGRKLFPIRMDGNNVIALRTPPYQGHGAVVSIDGSTLKQTVLMELPNDDKILSSVLKSFGNRADDLLYDKGRLYIGDRLTDKSSDEIEGPHYLFAVLGTN